MVGVIHFANAEAAMFSSQ